MELVSFTVDGYPCLDKGDYTANLHQYIADKKALILRDVRLAVGVMGFSSGTGSIDFLAVHPQCWCFVITKLFLDKLAEELLCGKEITLTTYRAGDKADTGIFMLYVKDPSGQAFAPYLNSLMIIPDELTDEQCAMSQAWQIHSILPIRNQKS